MASLTHVAAKGNPASASHAAAGYTSASVTLGLDERVLSWQKGPPCLLVDKEGIVRKVNDAALRVLRCSLTDVVNKPVSLFVAGDGSDSPSTGEHAGSPVRSGSASITALATRQRGYARLISTTEDGSGSEMKSFWLEEPRSPTAYRRSDSALSSPMGRLSSMHRHLDGNVRNQVALAAGEDRQEEVLLAFDKGLRLRDEFNLLEILEAGGSLGDAIDEESTENALKRILEQKELAAYLPRILINQASLSLLKTKLPLDWTRLEFVILRLVENACKNTDGPVKLSLFYDSSAQKFHVQIADEGKGIRVGTDYLERAVQGLTAPDGPEKDIKPGQIFRLSHLLCTKVMNGQFTYATAATGTVFDLVIPAAFPDVTDVAMGELVAGRSDAGAGALPKERTRELEISAKTLTPPRALVRLPPMPHAHPAGADAVPTFFPDSAGGGEEVASLDKRRGSDSTGAGGGLFAFLRHALISKLDGEVPVVSRTATVGKPPIASRTGPTRHSAEEVERMKAAAKQLAHLATPVRAAPAGGQQVLLETVVSKELHQSMSLYLLCAADQLLLELL